MAIPGVADNRKADKQTLVINGVVQRFEDVKVQKGAPTRNFHPQYGGGTPTKTEDISTNVSMITVTVRNDLGNIKDYETFFSNGENNTIEYGEDGFVNCTMEVLPEVSLGETSDYVFKADPLPL